MTRARYAAGAALLVAGLAAAQDVSNWAASPAVGLGPLQLRAQSPLAILRLSPTPEAPVTLSDGQWQLGLLTSWNNYFDYDPQYYTIDAETLRFTVTAAYGLTPRLEVHAALPLSYRGGGILDRFIENFEGLLHVANQQRKLAPRNRYLVLIKGTRRPHVRAQRGGRRLGDRGRHRRAALPAGAGHHQHPGGGRVVHAEVPDRTAGIALLERRLRRRRRVVRGSEARPFQPLRLAGGDPLRRDRHGRRQAQTQSALRLHRPRVPPLAEDVLAAAGPRRPPPAPSTSATSRRTRTRSRSGSSAS